MDKIVAERYKLMTPDRRMRIASSRFETARAIIESSLLTVTETQTGRCHICSRVYHCGESCERPKSSIFFSKMWQQSMCTVRA